MYYHCIERWYFSSFYHVFASGCGSLVGQGMHNTASRGGVGEMLLEQVLNIAGTGWRLKIGDAGDAGEAGEEVCYNILVFESWPSGLEERHCRWVGPKNTNCRLNSPRGFSIDMFLAFIHLGGSCPFLSFLCLSFGNPVCIDLCVCRISMSQLVAGLRPTCSSFPEVMMEKASFYLMQQTWSY